MLGLTTGSSFTKMTLHDLGDSGQVRVVDSPAAQRLTTRDVPMALIKNMMDLHESAAPGSVKGFAKSVLKVGLMEELLTDAVDSRSQLASPSKRVDMRNPESVTTAFYAASFLQNEEAAECLVYSRGGKVVGMAQIGDFAKHVEGLSCTISNLVVSPKLDAVSQGSIIRHVAGLAKERQGEATLLTPEPWGTAYRSHGFSIEAAGPAGSTIMQHAGVAPVCQVGRGNVVRCRWTQ